jgi:hypothetical protein
MTLDAVETLISVARAHLWVREYGGPNRGQGVEAILALVHLKAGAPWCAAFVAYIGHAVLGVAWPLPLVGGCATIGDVARAKKLIRTTPQAGDVFILHLPAKRRFGHTGFVTVVHADGSCGTIEGNTSSDGSPEGTGVFERVRQFNTNDRFVRVVKE